MMNLIRSRGEGIARIAAALAVIAGVAALGVLHPAGRADRSLPRVFSTEGSRLAGCSEAERKSISGRMSCADFGTRLPESRTIRFVSSGGG